VPPFWEANGSSENLLGTDSLGRDVLSRVIHGARVSLLVGGTTVGLAAMLGSVVGMVMGYARGHVTWVLLRITEVQQSFPFVVLAITVAAVFGASVANLLFVLILWTWPAFARLTRAQVLLEKEKDYVLAARAIGASDLRIMRRELRPNVLPPVVVLATLTLAQVILLESGLSFLGFGVPPPLPTWGGMLTDGRDYIFTAWWLITFPGLALMLTVLAVNSIGNYVQDRLSTPEGS
jgi:peptide/nickel transport system permease protein